MENEFTDVTIDEVHVSTTLSTQARSFKVAKVQVKSAGVYRTLKSTSQIRAKAGRKLHFRVFLTSPRNKFGSKVVLTSVRVPADTSRGSFGSVSLGTAFSDFEGSEGSEDFSDEGPFDDASAPASFAELIDSLETAPRNDELATTLQFFDEETDSSSTTATKKLVSDVITNDRSFDVRVVR
jgi:hypothetical protein